MTAACASVAADEMGDATTLVNIVQRIGGAIGAVAVAVTLAHTGGGVGAYAWAFALLTGRCRDPAPLHRQATLQRLSFSATAYPKPGWTGCAQR
jgi:hypothetical protein